MHRVDGADHNANQFSAGVQGVTPATTITVDILNAFQEEIATTIESAGIALDKVDNDQLSQAIAVLISKVTLVEHLFLTDGIGVDFVLPAGFKVHNVYFAGARQRQGVFYSLSTALDIDTVTVLNFVPSQAIEVSIDASVR